MFLKPCFSTRSSGAPHHADWRWYHSAHWHHLVEIGGTPSLQPAPWAPRGAVPEPGCHSVWVSVCLCLCVFFNIGTGLADSINQYWVSSDPLFCEPLAQVNKCVCVCIMGVHLSFIGRSDTYLDACCTIQGDTLYVVTIRWTTNWWDLIKSDR